jgi:hypothetical protein
MLVLRLSLVRHLFDAVGLMPRYLAISLSLRRCFLGVRHSDHAIGLEMTVQGA